MTVWEHAPSTGQLSGVAVYQLVVDTHGRATGTVSIAASTVTYSCDYLGRLSTVTTDLSRFVTQAMKRTT